ncbi:hypothetical protein [Streptomyces werraensis]|uniref:hypothetical protein n=1 Tax=Streptomyces werraensis TaxID=68284 RepID=UPI0037FE9ED2
MLVVGCTRQHLGPQGGGRGGRIGGGRPAGPEAELLRKLQEKRQQQLEHEGDEEKGTSSILVDRE